jgi:hypothetical protein
LFYLLNQLTQKAKIVKSPRWKRKTFVFDSLSFLCVQNLILKIATGIFDPNCMATRERLAYPPLRRGSCMAFSGQGKNCHAGFYNSSIMIIFVGRKNEAFLLIN